MLVKLNKLFIKRTFKEMLQVQLAFKACSYRLASCYLLQNPLVHSVHLSSGSVAGCYIYLFNNFVVAPFVQMSAGLLKLLFLEEIPPLDTAFTASPLWPIKDL